MACCNGSQNDSRPWIFCLNESFCESSISESYGKGCSASSGGRDL